MKLLKFLFLFLFISINFVSISIADIKITDWKEDSQILKTGRIYSIQMKAIIENLPQNYFTKSYSIGFDKKQNIDINQVLVDNKMVNYDFKDNVLKVDFTGLKKNGDTLIINYIYEEKYKNVIQTLRQEPIYIPKFANGAKAKITISYPDNIELISLNKNITNYKNLVSYESIAPEEGYLDILKFTPKNNVWDVTVKYNVSFDKPTVDLEVNLPIIFYNGGQKVEDQKLTSNIIPISRENKDGIDFIKYKLQPNNQNIVIKNRAIIYTGSRNFTKISRDFQNYLSVDPEESAILMPILQKIRNSSEYGNIALYAKIGKYVNDYIKYDIKYFGKNLTISEIIKTKFGVCSEYANLYNGLARVAGIPSLVVNGFASAEYNKFENHAWNMIFYNNKWIQVDPTWNLFSGQVSSSHIYVKDASNKEDITVKFNSTGSNSELNRDFEISLIQ